MARDKNTIEIGGVRLTSPDKVLYAEQGVTKRDLASYLLEAADVILPHLARRPVSLVRCPEGQEGTCFFQKHGMPGFPESLRRIEIAEKDGGRAEYLYIEDAAGLIAAAQMGVLELHIWGSHIDKLERPDRLVFDFDPAEDLGFADVKMAAKELREILAAGGLKSFPLLTGGKGIHVVAPIDRRHDWDTVKRYAAGLARALAAVEPGRFTAKAAKAGRTGRIFIDWMRNERGATAIAPYSPRARAGAPVAVPVSWDELAGLDAANVFKLSSVGPRLKTLKDDPWPGYFDLRQTIRKQTLDLVEKGEF